MTQGSTLCQGKGLWGISGDSFQFQVDHTLDLWPWATHFTTISLFHHLKIKTNNSSFTAVIIKRYHENGEAL